MSTAVAHQKVGRPYIGPKVQTFAPEQIHAEVAAEAEERGCAVSAVWRELLLEAAAARYGLEADR
jgi:hypothetical protein